MSSYETFIATILSRAKIPFVREKTFGNLKHGLFRFDFYLPTLNILIEVDGQQHFQQVTKFHQTQKDFKHALENDRRKNSYCLANNIRLFRIPYWELNNIRSFSDIVNNKFLVKNRWHNDYLIRGRKK